MNKYVIYLIINAFSMLWLQFKLNFIKPHKEMNGFLGSKVSIYCKQMAIIYDHGGGLSLVHRVNKINGGYFIDNIETAGITKVSDDIAKVFEQYEKETLDKSFEEQFLA